MTPETITRDELVRLQVDVPDSVQRYIKASAALTGETMGEFVTGLVQKFTTYQKPKEQSRA